MACNRSNEIPSLSMDEGTYLSQQLSLSPQSRPVDFFKPDPLAANWTYDNAIDLFALNSNDMESVPFDFSLNDLDSKDLFVDPFAGSPEISGFSMPMPEDNASLSSVCPTSPNLYHSTRLTFSRNLIVTINHGHPMPHAHQWTPPHSRPSHQIRPATRHTSPNPRRAAHHQDGPQAPISKRRQRRHNHPSPPQHPAARPAASPETRTAPQAAKTRRCGTPPSVPHTTSSRSVTAPT